MKVRQAIPVTSELGDTSKLARFDGECPRPVLYEGGGPWVSFSITWPGSTLERPGPSTRWCGPVA